MLWYSLEAPRRGASNEYPQHMFSSSNKKHVDTFLVEKKAPYQDSAVISPSFNASVGLCFVFVALPGYLHLYVFMLVFIFSPVRCVLLRLVDPI